MQHPTPIPATVFALFGHAGATIHATPMVADVPPRPGPPAMHVADLGRLPCWWVPVGNREARKWSRALARAGHHGLLLAGTDDHLHELVVTIRPCRPCHVGSMPDVSLGLTRLRRLVSTGTRLGDALAAAAALDLDARGRQTFERLRDLITTSRASVDGPTDPDLRHAWLLLQVTRILFLRFVESEGWLDGSPTFLRDVVDAALRQGSDPGRDLLEPLFFGTLNRPRHRRDPRSMHFGRIPFLNGGLFEPHPLERAHRWRLPPADWQVLLDCVINGTEVALAADSHPDAISPEMLGRILEGLMHPDERALGGVFYTPPALVDAVVRETIVSHLALRLGRRECVVRRALEAPDPELTATLGALRVLDPAVGSGAFLVGALQVLRRGATNQAGATRALITHNLHGIDTNPTAVRITELRLWLELLRTMRGTDVDAVDPLPNLDAAIRAGDALLDPLEGRRIPTALVANLRTARAAIGTTHGAAHRAAHRRLVAAEVAAMDAALESALRRLQQQHCEATEAGQAASLFGSTGAGAPALPVVEEEIRRIEHARERLHREGHAAGFAIESAWSDVLADRGFDLVVGNPPWVRSERLDRETRARLSARYRWWRTRGRAWSHPPDLSIAFVERSLGLLRPGGTLGMLVPGKMTTTSYAGAARAALVRETTLHVVADLADDSRASFDATTYPLALIASRSPARPRHAVRGSLELDGRSTPQSSWSGARAWTSADAATTRLLAKLQATHPTVSESHAAAVGVKTGANDVFLDPPESLARWTRPAIRGRDVTEEGIRLRHTILWPVDPAGRPFRQLPPELHDYLAPVERRLRRRADQRRGPWWQLFRVGPASARWRIIWPDIASTLRAVALDDPGPVPLNSCYVVACTSRDRMHRLAHWLAMPFIGALACLGAERAAGGYHRFGARVVDALPCPERLWESDAFGSTALLSPADRVARAVDLLDLDEADRATLLALPSTGR